MCLSSDSLSLQHAVGGGASVSRTDRAAVRVRCVEVFGGPKVRKGVWFYSIRLRGAAARCYPIRAEHISLRDALRSPER